MHKKTNKNWKIQNPLPFVSRCQCDAEARIWVVQRTTYRRQLRSKKRRDLMEEEFACLCSNMNLNEDWHLPANHGV